MNVQIRTVHFDASQELIQHIEKKVNKLKNFHDKITGVEVYLKLDSPNQKIQDKIVEIKAYVPSRSLFAKHESKIFEESFDQAFESLLTQLKRQKQKLTA